MGKVFTLMDLQWLLPARLPARMNIWSMINSYAKPGPETGQFC
jgi:hypothetical protein